MKRHFLLFLTASILCCCLSVSCDSNNHESSTHDIIVLYENDVHCGVDGYANFAALKDEMKATHKYVTVVSNGDFVQGGSLGAASHGRNIINIMNEVGYDYVTLGNHEFDYGIPRQMELMEELNAECLCCNFKDLRTGKPIYDAYHIVNYDGFDVAYIGMSTPYTINSSTPTYFKDENGNFVYSFCIDNFYDVVQEAVNSARKEGADFVVVLSHLGDEDEGEGGINSPSMIENTYGIDVVLDGHSHSVILDSIIKNKNGENVTLTSTGTKFQYMGVLTINPKGTFKTELIPTETYTKTNPTVLKVIEDIKEGYKKVSEQVIFTSEVKLAAYDDQKNRLVRSQETNIGDFCADAYRTVFGTDIAFLGGGSIRADLPQGDVTFNDIYTMFPFENGTCKGELTGELLLDILEHSVSIAPGEFGGFQQVSGLRFEYDSSIPSPVVYDADHSFAGVDGKRRVKKVEIMNKETGKYEPLDPNKTYTFAASSYIAIDHGDGFAMMDRCTNIQDAGVLDTDIIQNFLENYKNNHVGTEYAGTEGRIKDIRK
ncbi:MAG: bifunctional metallophosphatase/5'-nucleotidase [Bacteroidaceae bacterium]|nr:bifunctional metallophosphatase/5'-nucleotidase [Bacteroidaceae bacterium]